MDRSEWGRGRVEAVGLSPQIGRKPEDRVAGWLPGGEEGLTWGDNVAGSPGPDGCLSPLEGAVHSAMRFASRSGTAAPLLLPKPHELTSSL